jgi:hypothetical protein
MSSSRSIAAARNRRAGGNEAPVQRGRPNTSIASQPAFSQQQQPTQRIGRAINQQQQQQQYQQQPGKQVVPVNKISVSDAIGLITIRLGRVETYMQQIQEEGVSGLSSGFSENVQLVDKEVLSNLTDRIYTLENKPENAIVNNKLSFLEKEVKEIKELLSSHIFKFTQFVSETEQKFLDVDAAFIEFEKNLQVPDLNEEEVDNIQLILDDSKEEPVEVEEVPGPTFSSVDLKNIINQELANSEISL